MKTYRDVIDFLHSKHLAVLATVTKDGEPQCATVFFHLGETGADQRFHLYFMTRRHTRKFTNLLATSHPKVAMVIGTDLEPYSVQLNGTAEFIESSDGINGLAEFGEKLVSDPQLYTLYFGKSAPKNPFPRIEGTDFAVYRVTPTWVRFQHPDATGEEIAYTQIVS